MRFQIPQFIDVEDKLFGPLTLKQFIYLAGGASVTVAAVVFLGLFFGLIVASPVIVLAGALAFYRPNNRPFINYLESILQYYTKDKLYIWNKKGPITTFTETEDATKNRKYSSIVVPNLSQSKLKDMNWELDVKKKQDEDLSDNAV